MLNLFARAGAGLYSVNPDLNNFLDASIGGDGRLDIQRDWNVYGGLSWNRLHDVFGTPNTSNTAGLPVTVYNQTIANAGYFQKFNRLSLRFDVSSDNYKYYDTTVGPDFIPNSDRNRNEWREALRLGYDSCRATKSGCAAA